MDRYRVKETRFDLVILERLGGASGEVEVSPPELGLSKGSEAPLGSVVHCGDEGYKFGEP